MFTKLLKYILSLAVIVAMAGCQDHLDGPDAPLKPGDPGTLTIRFKNSNMSRSADSDNAENIIKNIKICFYPSPETIDESTTLPVLVEDVKNITASGEYQVVLHLDDDMIEKLFPNGSGSKCLAYALVNADNMFVTSILPEKPTIEQIKDFDVITNFAEKRIPDSFVMAGQGEVEYTAAALIYNPGTAVGKIDLKRTAAKIKLNIKLPEEVTDENDVVWRPVPDTGEQNIRVLLNNGVKASVAVPGDGYQPMDVSYYYDSELNKTESIRALSTANGNGDYTYGMSVPFYTYPNLWTESPYETHKTTLTLMVPWQKGEDPTYKTLYYQVPITPSDLPHIDSNHSYTINLNVGMLGSLVKEEPIELTDLTYQVVDWADADIDVSIQDTRYLVVNSNYISVNNQSSVSIPYYTSHPVEIYDIRMEYQRFNFYDNGQGETVTIPISKEQIDRSTYVHQVDDTNVTDTICNYRTVSTGSNQTSIVVNHALELWTPVEANGTTEVDLTGNADGSLANVLARINKYVRPDNPEAAYSSYKIVVKFRHKDNSAYNDSVIITQYPGMYIEVKPNPGDGTYTSTIPYYSATSYNDVVNVTHAGNVYVNDSKVGNALYRNPSGQVTGTGNYLGNILSSISGGGNSNPNMYVVSISQLDDQNSNYVIGDPRTEYYDNDLRTENGRTLPTPTIDGGPAGAWVSNDTTIIQGVNWCASAEALYPLNSTTERTLTYYRPTNESSEDNIMMRVAPKFRVASSYGRTINVNRNAARRRMATYQELNCPAGRWRLPTVGELDYIVKLSVAGKIPTLFNNGTKYWSAQGLCIITESGAELSSEVINEYTRAPVRGVYDEWYWEQYPQYTIEPTGTNYAYTLGDMPRVIE
ncbi:MAG: hypothetical protein K2L17_07270 [Muribaculaceae bacterium]|nr:hypothetical protein [Muribaculaceae bacterium]